MNIDFVGACMMTVPKWEGSVVKEVTEREEFSVERLVHHTVGYMVLGATPYGRVL